MKSENPRDEKDVGRKIKTTSAFDERLSIHQPEGSKNKKKNNNNDTLKQL